MNTLTRYLILIAILPTLVALAVVGVSRVGGPTFNGPLPDLSNDQVTVANGLQTYVQELAEGIGARSPIHRGSVEITTNYVQDALEVMGFEVTSHSYTAAGLVWENLTADIVGTTRPDEIILVGAHYDSHRGSTGADANASGVAGAFELARLLKTRPMLRTVRFAFFGTGELPYRGSDQTGSHAYAVMAKDAGLDLVAVVCLDSIGFYSDSEGSQEFPFPFKLTYPERGNFVGVFGAVGSRALVDEIVQAWNGQRSFPVEGGATLPVVPFLESDHEAFAEAGFPSVLVTDTRGYRNQRAGSAADSMYDLDFERTARVVTGLADVIQGLADAAR